MTNMTLRKIQQKLKVLSPVLILLLIAGFVAPLSTVVATGQNGSSNQSGPSNNGTTATDTITNSTHESTPVAYSQESNSSSQQGNQGNSGENCTSTPCPSRSPTGNQGSGSSNGPNYAFDDVKQYNQTNITPKGNMEQVQAREQTLFQYRNMTMLMNCTRNCTVVFTADDTVEPKVFGLTVDPNQTMTLAMNLTKSPLNGAMVNERSLNFYLGIEPNATLQLQAQIRLHINQTEINHNMNREVNTQRLTWMYWNQTQAQWEAVESYMDENGYLVCNTNHFSTWTVAEVTAEEATPNQANTIDTTTIYLIAVTIAVVAIIGIGIIALKRRK
jgi:hypothetical protein